MIFSSYLLNVFDHISWYLNRLNMIFFFEKFRYITFYDLLVIKHSHTRSKIIFSSLNKWSFFRFVYVFYGNKCQQHASSLVICHIISYHALLFSKHVQWERKSAVHIIALKSFDSLAVNRTNIHTYICIYLIIVMMMMMHLKTNISTIKKNCTCLWPFSFSSLIVNLHSIVIVINL
jgi:hypothetical protein